MTEALQKQLQAMVDIPYEARVIQHGHGYAGCVKTANGNIFFFVAEVSQSRQSLDGVLEIEINSDAYRPQFIQRIDFRSNSAIKSLVTDLNNAYGGKKDKHGYNWALILNSFIAALSAKIRTNTKVISMAEVQFEEPTFLLRPFLQQGAANLVFAQSEAGKTFFVQRMVLSLATGAEFLGYPSPKGIKTLYLDYEDSPQAFASRLHKLCKGMHIDYKESVAHILYYKPQGSLRDNVEVIRRIVSESGIEVIVIDAGGNAAGGSPSDEERVVDLFNALEEIPGTKIILHHEPKYVQSEQAAFYGSMYWKALSRVAWRLEVESEDQDSKLIKLTIQKKSNLPPQPAIYYKQRFIGTSLDDIMSDVPGPLIPSVVFEISKPPPREEKSIDDILLEEITKGAASESQLAQLSGYDKSYVGKRLRVLKDNGFVEQSRDGKGVVWRMRRP